MTLALLNHRMQLAKGKHKTSPALGISRFAFLAVNMSVLSFTFVNWLHDAEYTPHYTTVLLDSCHHPTQVSVLSRVQLSRTDLIAEYQYSHNTPSRPQVSVIGRRVGSRSAKASSRPPGLSGRQRVAHRTRPEVPRRKTALQWRRGACVSNARRCTCCWHAGYSGRTHCRRCSSSL